MSDWAKGADSKQELPKEIQDWFASYRQALPDLNPGAAFMPALWQKIEAKQRSENVWFGRLARHFVTATVAFCLGMMAMLVAPVQTNSASASQTYVEILDQSPAPDSVDVEAHDDEEVMI